MRMCGSAVFGGVRQQVQEDVAQEPADGEAAHDVQHGARQRLAHEQQNHHVTAGRDDYGADEGLQEHNLS